MATRLRPCYGIAVPNTLRYRGKRVDLVINGFRIQWQRRTELDAKKQRRIAYPSRIRGMYFAHRLAGFGYLPLWVKVWTKCPLVGRRPLPHRLHTVSSDPAAPSSSGVPTFPPIIMPSKHNFCTICSWTCVRFSIIYLIKRVCVTVVWCFVSSMLGIRISPPFTIMGLKRYRTGTSSLCSAPWPSGLSYAKRTRSIRIACSMEGL